MQRLIFLDVETTGTEDFDKLCEVAFKVYPEGNYKEEKFKPSLDISFEAMSIHHITNEEVKDKGVFHESEMFREIQKEISEGTIFVAHNAPFDMSFLEREGIKVPEKQYICTMKISHHHDTKAELTKNNLQYLRYRYGLTFDQEINPHQAMSDIIVLEKLFQFYQTFYSIEQMLEISGKPILIKKMPFGKYRGKLMSDIAKADADYLNWLYRETNLDVNLKYTVAKYLGKVK